MTLGERRNVKENLSGISGDKDGAPGHEQKSGVQRCSGIGS